jgi:hypothetical protein
MSCTPPQRPTHCEHCRQHFGRCDPPGVILFRELALCWSCWDLLTSARPAEPPNLQPVALETLIPCQASGSTGALQMRQTRA